MNVLTKIANSTHHFISTESYRVAPFITGFYTYHFLKPVLDSCFHPENLKDDGKLKTQKEWVAFRTSTKTNENNLFHSRVKKCVAFTAALGLSCFAQSHISKEQISTFAQSIIRSSINGTKIVVPFVLGGGLCWMALYNTLSEDDNYSSNFQKTFQTNKVEPSSWRNNKLTWLALIVLSGGLCTYGTTKTFPLANLPLSHSLTIAMTTTLGIATLFTTKNDDIILTYGAPLFLACAGAAAPLIYKEAERSASAVSTLFAKKAAG